MYRVQKVIQCAFGFFCLFVCLQKQRENEIIQSDTNLPHALNTWDISKSPPFQWGEKISQDEGTNVTAWE